MGATCDINISTGLTTTTLFIEMKTFSTKPSVDSVDNVENEVAVEDSKIIAALDAAGFKAEPRTHVWWIVDGKFHGHFFGRKALEEEALRGTMIEYVHSHLSTERKDST